MRMCILKCSPFMWAPFFCLFSPRSCTPSPDYGQISIHHTRLAQCHPGVHSLRGHRGPKGDLGEHGPSQGAENNAGSILTLLDPDSEPAPESTQCQLDLCGQQSGGSENCHLRPGGSLCLWWVHLPEGKGTVRAQGWGSWAFLPTMLLTPPFNGSPDKGVW